MISATWYGQAALGQISGDPVYNIDWTGDDIKVALIGPGYSPDIDTDDFFDLIEPEEIPTTGDYTPGGLLLANRTTSYDGPTNEPRLFADAATWSGMTADIAFAVIYKDSGTPATSPLMGIVDFGGTQSISSAGIALGWDSTGVLKGRVITS